jgi:hypothetical protein
MNRIVIDSLTYAALLSSALPLVIIAKVYNEQPPVIRWLSVILTISLSADLGSRLFYAVTSSSPNFIGNVYNHISIPIICIFFYKAIGYRSIKKTLIGINVSYVTFAMCNVFFIQKSAINSFTLMATSVIIIGLSITFFFMLLKELPTQQLHTMPLFWIVSGFFFSFSGKLVVYTTTHYLVTYIKDNLIFVWSFHILLSIIANLLIAYGTWLNLKQISRSISSSQ